MRKLQAEYETKSAPYRDKSIRDLALCILDQLGEAYPDNIDYPAMELAHRLTA
jgi:hypothetical protein